MAKQQAKPDGTHARRAAVKILYSVLDKGEAFDDALARELGAKELANHPSDRAFARAIATLVLRRLGQIDDLMKTLPDKPARKSTSPHQRTHTHSYPSNCSPPNKHT